MLAHCLAKTNMSPAMLQIAVAASASAIRLGNTAPDSTKMRLVQPSLAAARAHVSLSLIHI